MVSFGLKSAKRPRLSQSGAFAAEDEAEHSPPHLTPEEALESSTREQAAGEAFAAQGKFSSALQCWNRAIALTPERALLHEMKAQALLEVDEVWAAMQCARQAVALAPNWPEAHLTLGRANIELGEPGLALSNMEEALRLQPGHTEATAEISTIRMLVQQQKQQNPNGGKRLHVVPNT
ncbi:hypothetical protein WJX73_003454 [Symbiochloris irregularis]|uniref:Uncharacterized protein n=1 Tax=Symbiochloris irregularis TaxID=706552 RepID=A0AAW1NRP8_9CHLO